MSTDTTHIQSLLKKAKGGLFSKGDAKAKYELGVAYESGRGVAKDVKTACEWYRRAAEQGNAWAQANLGWMYLLGLGVEQDEEIASEWYARADEVLEPDSRRSMRNVKNVKMACHWYIKGARQGYVEAQFKIAEVYANGQGVAKDEITACMWYKCAAQQGNVDAKIQLETMAERGVAAAKEALKALSEHQVLLEKSEAADKDAQFKLGVAYESGERGLGPGVAGDVKTACKWFTRAAEQGHVLAQFWLGSAHYYGVPGVAFGMRFRH